MSSYLNRHDQDMASLRMTPAQFTAALTARGFVYDAATNRWNGPFGITVPGDSLDPVIRNDLDRAYARGAAIRYADAQIAGKRKLV